MKFNILFSAISFIFIQSLYAQNTQLIDSLLTKIETATIQEKVNTYGRLFALHVFKKTEQSKTYLDSMAKYIEFEKHKIDSAYLNRNYARYHNRINKNKEALQYILISNRQFEELNEKEQVAYNYNNTALIEIALGNFENATSYLIKALKLREAMGSSEYKKLPLYSKLGQVYGQLNNLEKSNEYFKIEEDILIKKGDNKKLATVWNNLAVNYKKNDSLKKSLYYYKKALNIYESTQNHWKLALTYGNLANLYVMLDSINLVMPLYNNALKSAKISKNQLETARILNNKGAFLIDQKEYRKAIKALEEANNINLNSGRKFNLAKNLSNLANAYAGINNYKKAYEYRVNEKKYLDSIKNKESLDKINELEIKYQSEKKEVEIALQKKEIETLSAKAKNDKLTKTLYGIGMFSFLAISGLIYFSFKQRIKKNRIERKKQEEILKQEIEFKKKELASQTLHLVQKNTFINELKENLEKIKQSPKLFKVEFRRLVMLLRKESAEDKDWEVFKSYFSEVHNNFDIKLKEIYNDITEKEIRLASFLRMNLSTKEIASMLNVLPESVSKSKYRLKKKLNLNKDVDLDRFLNKL